MQYSWLNRSDVIWCNQNKLRSVMCDPLSVFFQSFHTALGLSLCSLAVLSDNLELKLCLVEYFPPPFFFYS